MKKNRSEWLSFLSKFDYKYFLTVTFCRNSPNSDKDLERFIRIIHQELFGRNYIKKKNLLGIAVVRENNEITIARNHYHILVEYNKTINITDIAKAICTATTKCNMIKNIPEIFYAKILIKNDLLSNSTDETTIKLYEFTPEEKRRVINYILKQGSESNYLNIYVANSSTSGQYFPIVTR